MMTMTNAQSLLATQVQVHDGNGHIKTLNMDAITRLIASLTADPQAIQRATDLIMRQLSFYSEIKEFDLKCLIFKTLKQLNYTKMAKLYHRKFLASEF